MNQGLTVQTIGIGVLAGATTVLLCLGLSSGSALAIFLYFISAVPLMVAGLGFGLTSAVIGAVAAIAGSLLLANGILAVLVALSIAAPACATGYWLNLARPAEEIGGPDGHLAWYPLADVLFVNALLTGLAFVAVGALIGFGPEIAGLLAALLISRFREANPELVFSPEAAESLRNFLETAIPVVQPFFWMMALTLSVYIATTIAQRSGLVKRPREDWPLALRMPRMAGFAFMAAIVVSFAPGSIGHIGGSFTGALGAGFALSGFAMLHARTRGMNGRFAILFAAYLAILVFGPLIFIAVFAGMFGAGRHIPVSPAHNSNPIQNKND